MTNAELERICGEVRAAFTGLRFGRVFPLSRTSFAIDFYPHSGPYLLVDIGPARRAVYLIRRRLKHLERAVVHSGPFILQMRALLSGRELTVVTCPVPGHLKLDFWSGAGHTHSDSVSLWASLNGTAANAVITDAEGRTLALMRGSKQILTGEIFLPSGGSSEAITTVRPTGELSLSEVLDAEHRLADEAREFDRLAATARRARAAEIDKRKKLVRNLMGDLEKHGDADTWKRYGDLILANLSTLTRKGNSVVVKDYFDPLVPDVSVPVEENTTPTEAADAFFKRYTKARNGAAAVAERLQKVRDEIESLTAGQARLEAAIASRDAAGLAEFLPARKQALPQQPPKRSAKETDLKGARRFVSSDGYEILVGKKAVDNDHLTFRVARSLDLWLHAADYPGSHVIIKNPQRDEIPDRTLLEAARLAAFYSDARQQGKAAVRYTQKKFVNKPRRAAPGLVSLASFKTVLVEPGVPEINR